MAHLEQLRGMPLASFSRRGAALAVDFALAGALFLPTALLTLRGLLAFGVLLADHDYHAELNFFDNWYSLAWLVLFFGLSNHVGNGQTLGKKLFGLRAVSLVHQRLQGWPAIERALAYGASALELGFGFLQYFLHPNRQTVHDRIAETIVTDERVARNPAQ
ncbi:MAG: RDD family protein [Vicinamibacterales bacterium]